MRGLLFLALLTVGCRTDDSGDPKQDDTAAERVDAVGDGWVEGEDCDDLDAAVNPDASERCDSVDSDFDGATDDGDEVDALTYYAVADLDGYGDAADPVTACEEPSGDTDTDTDTDTDCDDGDPDINPAASEPCDGLGNDCDGDVDEDSAVAGDGAACPAADCAAILAARPLAADGTC